MSPQWWFYAVAAVITSPNPWQVHHGSLQKRPVKWFGLELSDGSPGLPTEAWGPHLEGAQAGRVAVRYRRDYMGPSQTLTLTLTHSLRTTYNKATSIMPTLEIGGGLGTTYWNVPPSRNTGSRAQCRSQAGQWVNTEIRHTRDTHCIYSHRLPRLQFYFHAILILLVFAPKPQQQ